MARRGRARFGYSVEDLFRTSPFSNLTTFLICSVVGFAVLALIVWSLLQGLALGAAEVDQHLAPGQPLLNDVASFAERLQNHTEMPPSCRAVVLTDSVANASVADACLTWCQRSLGPGAGLPYAFSPLHWNRLKSTHIADVQQSFRMCWKVETAAWALAWLPEVWQMYVAACVYGSISCVSFLCELSRSAHESDSDESNEADTSESDQLRAFSTSRWLRGPDDEGFCEGGPFIESRTHRLPFCCVGIHSDHEGAMGQLRVSAFLMIFEPALDVLSTIMFLRRGQPIYAAIVGASVAVSRVLACDAFQIRGALAMAQSLARGFATRELYQHRTTELFESVGATIVQCYAALRMDMASANLSAVITLIASAGISLAVSMPDACRAFLVLWRGEPAWENYYRAEETKANVTVLQRYWPSVLCLTIAEAAVLLGRHYDGQLSSTWTVLSAEASCTSLELYISALLLFLFRVVVLVGLLVGTLWFCVGFAMLAFLSYVLDNCGG